MTVEEPTDILFTEITLPEGAPRGGDTLVAGERS